MRTRLVGDIDCRAAVEGDDEKDVASNRPTMSIRRGAMAYVSLVTCRSFADPSFVRTRPGGKVPNQRLSPTTPTVSLSSISPP